MKKPNAISKATIDRLPLYFRTLRLLQDEGRDIISSDELGRRLGITPEQIRKDLASFGQFGKKGVGYYVNELKRNIGGILGLDNHWNIAIVGIGAPVKSSNLVWAGYFGRDGIDSMRRTGAVGEICSVFYDKDGNPVQTPFTDRTIAVPLDTLRNLPYCIGMAASREKVPAIMGALHGHLINVLITDESTATILLHE